MKFKIIITYLFIYKICFSIENQIYKNESLKIVNTWLLESVELTKNCVGFSAPVAARAFAYLTVGVYECGIEERKDYQSLSNQLSGYNRGVWKKNTDILFLPHVYNYVCYKLEKIIYANMPPANLKRIEKMKDSIYHTYNDKASLKDLKRAEVYVDKLVSEYVVWMNADGADKSYNKNFPDSYISPKCGSCWVSTFPGYLKPLQPYWGKNRLMVDSNSTTLKMITPPVFSSDSSSGYYKDALNLFVNSKLKIKEHEIIAEYWDDSPGFSGTPTGHQLAFALQLANDKQLNIEQALHFYSLLCISMNDAFILCWHAKYTYNLMRPITYIQLFISPHFNTVIPTPSFSEFPSGHSFQSAAAGEVYKYFFSDSLKIEDRTNLYRTDIKGMPRQFKNFSKMVDEISISRFYGGIHYLTTLDATVEYGKYLGRNTIRNLKFKK